MSNVTNLAVLTNVLIDNPIEPFLQEQTATNTSRKIDSVSGKTGDKAKPKAPSPHPEQGGSDDARKGSLDDGLEILDLLMEQLSPIQKKMILAGQKRLREEDKK